MTTQCTSIMIKRYVVVELYFETSTSCSCDLL